MTESIRTVEQSVCPVCGSTGNVLFRNLKDKLFGVPGTWSNQRCSNLRCRSIWIDPVIVSDELYKAYRTYYTHAENSAQRVPSAISSRRLIRRFYDSVIKEGYWAARYGYSEASLWQRLWSCLVYLHPTKRTDLDVDIAMLPMVKGGCVLDVGCGNGERLQLLSKLGWKVRGIDFDRDAVNGARARGLDVDCGDLRCMAYPGASLDAIVLSHVIEHVPDPGGFVKECARLLKKGGFLGIVTPNADSFGLRYYGRCWRGLEPPRHLQIFTQPALSELLLQSGLGVMEGSTRVGPQILYASEALKLGTYGCSARLPRNKSSFIRVLTLLEWLVHKFNPRQGEVLTVRAVRL